MKLLEQQRPLMNQAKNYYQKGELFKAAAILKNILKRFPQHKEAKKYLDLTKQHINKGNNV